MELQNKKVLFLGDSITEGVGASDREHRFTDVFARLSGAEVYNYGISGTRIARQRNPSQNPRWDLNFLDRVEEMNPAADVVVVFGGTNDFGHGDGALGDFYSRDEYTFYGAMHSLVNRLVNRYPEALLLFMTPLHRASEDDPVNEIGLARHLLREYVAAQREVLTYYSIPVLDLYGTSGLTPKIPVIRERFMPDGLHPSDAGAERIATMLYRRLLTL